MVNKIKSLKNVDVGSLIDFDICFGVVINGDEINKKYTDNGKAIILISFSGSVGRFWGEIANGYFDEFKKGNYKRIIKAEDVDFACGVK